MDRPRLDPVVVVRVGAVLAKENGTAGGRGLTMPELPEVEYAAQLARRVVVGRTIRRIRVLHRSQQRTLPVSKRRTLVGDVVESLERRGKYQIFHLRSGRAMVVHFRMTGDWEFVGATDPMPSRARVVIELDDAATLALVDARALATVSLHESGAGLLPDLGPEANTAAFNAAWLGRWLARRTGPVKLALLDQRAVAGIGNVYASEALWFARLDPRHRANTLGAQELRRLVSGVKRAMRKALAHPERYYGAGAGRFNVYDREGRSCRRCGAPIKRVVQGGRSTYWCGGCQV
ncbi:MAG: Fpg/Nei family DNA glycosylase [Gemmatimonadaceae bacterium]